MKALGTLLTVLLMSTITYSQNASDYFYSYQGVTPYYFGSVLDSLNEPIDSFGFYQKDSFAVTSNFHGEESSLILSSFASAEYPIFSPALDSSFFMFSGAKAFEYIRIADILDTLFYEFFDSTIADTLSALDGWYPLFDMSANVNEEAELLTKDFTVSNDTLEINLRMKIITERFSDEELQTELGIFQTKKFLNALRLYFLIQILPPPLPPQEIPFVTVERIVWIAANNWIVKTFAPAQTYDFTQIGGKLFYIPGAQKERITEPMFVSVKDNNNIADNFSLEQNYPNPFNPATTIKFSVPSVNEQNNISQLLVQLKVYDVLGQQVTTLVNEQKAPGNYEIVFNAQNLPSGIYFYTLTAGNYRITKKMTLLK